MEGICVFLVGSSLFADNVAHMLRETDKVTKVKCFPSISDALDSIETKPPDVLIFVDVDTLIRVGNTPFLPICPDIPVICTDHQSNILKLITSTLVSARLPDLVNAVATLKSVQAQR